MSDLVNRIRETRRRLVETRIALRVANDSYGLYKAQAEQQAIDAAGGEKALGANEAARARALILAISQDTAYQQARETLQTLQATAERLEAELEDLKDERREREWDIRARLADALDSRAVQTDHEDPADDGAFDDVADETAIEAARPDLMYEQVSAGELLSDLMDQESDRSEPEAEEVPF